MSYASLLSVPLDHRANTQVNTVEPEKIRYTPVQLFGAYSDTARSKQSPTNYIRPTIRSEERQVRTRQQ